MRGLNASMRGMERTSLKETEPSIGSVIDRQPHWYALKVFFNKVFEIEEHLNSRGIESYFPTETVVVEKGGRKKKVIRPVISSLMFFRTSRQVALEQQKELTDRVILYVERIGYSREPVAISDVEMERFRLVASSGEEGLEYFGADSPEFRKGEHVCVIDGPFKGAEGYIRRVKGNHRLFVSIRGVCAVATSYIPRIFLKKMEP